MKNETVHLLKLIHVDPWLCPGPRDPMVVAPHNLDLLTKALGISPVQRGCLKELLRDNQCFPKSHVETILCFLIDFCSIKTTLPGLLVWFGSTVILPCDWISIIQLPQKTNKNSSNSNLPIQCDRQNSFSTQILPTNDFQLVNHPRQRWLPAHLHQLFRCRLWRCSLQVQFGHCLVDPVRMCLVNGCRCGCGCDIK